VKTQLAKINCKNVNVLWIAIEFLTIQDLDSAIGRDMPAVDDNILTRRSKNDKNTQKCGIVAIYKLFFTNRRTSCLGKWISIM